LATRLLTRKEAIMKSLSRLILSVTIAALYSAPAQADEVVLDNGVTLTGTVTKMLDDVLSIESLYAKPIEVKKAWISRIRTDNPVEVHLFGGEIVKGKVETAEDGQLTVDEGLGRTATGIPLGSVQAINPPPVDKWHGNVSVAANVQSGNTDRSGAAASADATRRSERDRFQMRFLYNIAQENGKLSTRNTFGALKYDYFFTKKFYGYLSLELLNDTFKDLNLRTVVGPGVGYQLWDDPVKALALEGGIAYYSEDLKAHPDRRWWSLRLAADFRYKFYDWLVFTDKLVLYPSLGTLGDFTLRNEAALLTALTTGWSLKLADITDYVNNPPSGTKSTDNQLIVGLQYTF
jgi:putative salt-induced outer membrane protein YdiY